MTMYGWTESGGGTTFPRAVAKALAKKGFDVSVFFAGGKHPENREPYYLDRNVEDGVKLFGVYNRPSVFLDAENPRREIRDENIVKLFRLVTDEIHPEIIHYHNFLGLSFAIADIAAERNIRTVYTPHNYHMIDPMLYLFNSDLSLWKNTDIFQNSDLVKNHPELHDDFRNRKEKALELLNNKIELTIAVSSRQRDILNEYGAESGKIAVVNQVHKTAENLKNIQSPEKDWSLPLRFGFIGGAMPHKGVHMIGLASQLIKGNVEFHVYGFINEQYAQIVKSLDKNGLIQFKGEYKPEDLGAIAGKLNAVIIPSVWEDCAPLVVAEALAMNLPVIGARIGGIPDFIEENYNGLLYDHDKPEQLAAIINDFAANPQMLKSLADNAFLPYGFSDYLEHLEMIYSGIFLNNKWNKADMELKFKEKMRKINK